MKTHAAMGMPTYAEYCAHAARRGFQPLGQVAFDALILAGFNPVLNRFA